ncbi:helix-turn-helix domain-containing protein [Halalkalibacter urbisdiaboli]|uniref:helix-turn-helix domain-containing protein n=1 Tax=Halalkalibacter urbisdiaboli TaxID=1960589 RepID=UPI000B43E8F7|nr:AraC family transcriptional regulator [Halalkalibacter urbisdiaboli]
MVNEQKYSIDEQFSIQYMYQTGYSTMVRPHTHSTYELFYVLNGGKVFFINETVYIAQKGDLILIQPNDIHRTNSSDELKCERILLNVSDSFIDKELTRFHFRFSSFSRSLFRFRLNKQAIIEELLQKMLEECQTKHIGYETYLRALLMELLILMHRFDQQVSKQLEPPTHPLYQKISEMARYMRKHYQSKLTLAEIAQRFFISPSYLSRSFKLITGFQFKDYLQIIRVQEAKRLLRETDKPIGRIAEEVGFEYVANFNVTFKKITGITPRDYRKRKQ